VLQNRPGRCKLGTYMCSNSVIRVMLSSCGKSLFLIRFNCITCVTRNGRVTTNGKFGKILKEPIMGYIYLTK
jgi:hypothetical protein